LPINREDKAILSLTLWAMAFCLKRYVECKGVIL
jgi:hypothetical protein